MRDIGTIRFGERELAFEQGARRLEYIVLPPSVQFIERIAFKYCRGLGYIIVQGEMPRLDEGALLTCNCFQAFVDMDGKVLFDRDDAIERGMGFF